MGDCGNYEHVHHVEVNKCEPLHLLARNLVIFAYTLWLYIAYASSTSVSDAAGELQFDRHTHSDSPIP